MASAAGKHPRAVVYTDLDGTLLDHDHYGWAAAAPALAALRERAIPVVPVTSKTVAELLDLRHSLALATPFAVENGGALAVPAGYFGADRGEAGPDNLWIERLGPAYEEILAALTALRRDGFRFTGFADLDTRGVMDCTGLVQSAAARARQRLCSEPLLWRDSDVALARFEARLAAENLRILRGGRFIHVLGDADKGKALRRLHARFSANGPAFAFALGDSPNDLDLLAAADRGVLVARSDGSYAAAADPPRLVHAGAAGPVGWCAAVTQWLDDMD